MSHRDAAGRFAKGPAPPRPWTILATDRRRLGGDQVPVNRRRDRLLSRAESTRIAFATEAAAEEYLARLPTHPRWCFTVTTL